MSDGPADSQRLDLDHTDELPILLETVVLPADAAASALEDTGEHTARFTALPVDQAPEVAALRTDLASRAARIDALESDIANLASRWNDVERHLTAKDLTIKSLTDSVSGLRESLLRVETAEQRLTAVVAERDTTIDRLHSEVAARDAELEALRSELQSLRSELAARTASVGERQELERVRQELADLSTYVTNRRLSWDTLEAEATAAKQQIAALRRDLVAAGAAQRSAEALAARETQRATRTRAELAAQSLELETARRELAAIRAAALEPDRRATLLMADLEAARTSAEHAAAELVAAADAHASERAALRLENQRQAADLAMLESEVRALRQAEQEAVARAAAEPALDVVAQLEAEVEHKRQQVTAQLVELRDRDQRLTTATTEVQHLQDELTTLRAELETARATMARLERTLVDRDRALETRDERIATLQDELSQRLDALQRLNAMDLSLQGLDSKMSERLHRTTTVEPSAPPALLCLTGDAPHQFALIRPVTTIGRSAHCDIQIMTHFVSREHARITVGETSVHVEDLGSTNGVFVNSTRVERRELHHGDVITIGETKFRFFESMAH